MPRLVADIHSGVFSASVCVGLRQDSRRVEWELLPVATVQLTPIATFGRHALTYKPSEGDRTELFLPLLFPSFEKGVFRSLAAKQNAPWVKWRGRIFESDDSGFDFCMPRPYPAIGWLVTDITSERFTISEHPPQSQIHQKLEPHIPRQRTVKRQPPSI